MKSFSLPAVLLCLASCQSAPSAEKAIPAATPPSQTTAAEPKNPEHIEANMVTVNGKPHEHLTTQLLISQLGRPDSIAKGAVECGGELETVNNANADVWYYGKTCYEVAGTQAVLSSFDVTTGKFQGKVGKLVLNQNTTLEDVRRYYPVSAKEAETPATGRPGEEMGIPFYHNGTPVDASLNLIFKNGRLQEVEFFQPC
ncbi:hypothetical protein [Hymenobacter cellulosilyticus]|uniref:Uncharacterized protein n=1 Tax=Hymenobacter cellulosilyticus TaxID=2932248 RepID=A0A8T9PXV1_9BACT|nr:hypothetical protein [Hymenobacter cellulosilyticus]UOQ70104.1 hypothetical protein MUN79_15135 [Hymenobacter cellulosilyticus]